MAVVLKIAHQGQTHRVTFDSMPNYAALEAAVIQTLPNCLVYSTKYTDEEDDLCTLVESTFSDFLTTAKDTPVGQVALRVEVLALPAPTPVCPALQATPSPQVQKSQVRRQKQAPKAPWVDDHRDLDELLQQFTEQPLFTKKTRKKKKTKSPLQASSPAQGANAAIGQDSDAASMEVANSQELDEEEMTANMCALPSEVVGGEAASFSELLDEDVVAEESEMFEDGAVGSESEMEQTLWAEDPDDHWAQQGTLQRASSCPCLSAMTAGNPEGGSLLAQAWPFVDPDKVVVDFAHTVPEQEVPCHADTLVDVSSPLLQSPAVQESPPSPPACMTAYQQVVWMPVLINWLSTERSASYPQMGGPLGLPPGPLPAIG